MNRVNYVIATAENDEPIAVNMDQVQAFWQDGEYVALEMSSVLTERRLCKIIHVKGTFIDLVNAVRKTFGVEPATIEQIKAVLGGGAE